MVPHTHGLRKSKKKRVKNERKEEESKLLYLVRETSQVCDVVVIFIELFCDFFM